jgi:hypothetical protein
MKLLGKDFLGLGGDLTTASDIIDFFALADLDDDATALLRGLPRRIVVGTSGNLSCLTREGTTVLLPVIAGEEYNFAIVKIFATNTTADGIIIGY